MEMKGAQLAGNRDSSRTINRISVPEKPGDSSSHP